MRTLRDSSTGLLLLTFLLLTSLLIDTAECRGGRGGGGRGGGSRGGSSRGSSSGSRRGGSTHLDRSRERSRPAPAPPAPPPPPPPAPKPAPKPSAPEAPRQQPAQNPNYREPPPYSPRERPPPYSPPQGPVAAQPPQPGFRQPNPGVAPPAYQPPGGVPGANYPRAPGGAPPPAGVPGANYPRAPGGAPPAGGVPGANYPRAPGVAPPPYQQPNPGGGANYPRAPGGSYPGGVAGANYPRQPGGIPGANYPRQPNAPLGGNVWQPQSGRPAPPYMNYGGLPTGANMASAPLKKKGFMGSLMSMGSHKGYSKKNKYYGSYPGPYGATHGMGHGGMGGFMGSRGSTAAMYTILPYMAMRHSSSMFRPRFGFMPLFLPSPFHYHSYGYGGGYGYGGYGGGYGRTHYDVYNSDYVGRCNKPLTPHHGKVVCNSTNKEVDCDVTCEEGYVFPDNSTHKLNKCWHVTGIWKPEKNFPECKPVCTVECLNGGSCASPGKCGCTPEYRGPRCEFHFLNCDVRKLAPQGSRIKWMCTHSKNETVCKVRCASDDTALPEVRCTPEGVWTPNALPPCATPKPTEAPEETTTIATNATTVTTEGPSKRRK